MSPKQLTMTLSPRSPRRRHTALISVAVAGMLAGGASAAQAAPKSPRYTTQIITFTAPAGLSVVSSKATEINAASTVAGTVALSDGSTRAFVATGTEATILPMSARGVTFTTATVNGVDGSDRVVGCVATNDNENRPARWSSTGLELLPIPGNLSTTGGPTIGCVDDVNEVGDMAGGVRQFEDVLGPSVVARWSTAGALTASHPIGNWALVRGIDSRGTLFVQEDALAPSCSLLDPDGTKIPLAVTPPQMQDEWHSYCRAMSSDGSRIVAEVGNLRQWLSRDHVGAVIPELTSKPSKSTDVNNAGSILLWNGSLDIAGNVVELRRVTTHLPAGELWTDALNDRTDIAGSVYTSGSQTAVRLVAKGSRFMGPFPGGRPSKN